MFCCAIDGPWVAVMIGELVVSGNCRPVSACVRSHWRLRPWARNWALSRLEGECSSGARQADACPGRRVFSGGERLRGIQAGGLAPYKRGVASARRLFEERRELPLAL